MNSTTALFSTSEANPVIITTSSHWSIPQIEIPYLLIIILVGVIGNVSIIGAIILEKKLKFVGNAFIVNLAVADLIVTAYVIPGVLANVIADKNLFSDGICQFTALVVSLSCLASMYSLMFIAINSFADPAGFLIAVLTFLVYIAVAHSNRYTDIFTKKKVGLFVSLIWIWSFILSIPPAFGWGHYRYHIKIHICMYDCRSRYFTYTASFICLSIFVPFIITCLCYFGVFHAFNKNRTRVRGMSNTNTSTVAVSGTKTESEMKRRKSRATSKRQDNERRLVITLFSAVCLFTICWVPYALIILINHDASAIYKRSAAWLAFTNSAMNSILYGVLHKNFRNGYRRMWSKVFSICCSSQNIFSKEDSSAASTKSIRYSTTRVKKSQVDFNTTEQSTAPYYTE